MTQHILWLKNILVRKQYIPKPVGDIQNAFEKNECKMKVLTHKDIINFKSKEAFPDYRIVMDDKVVAEFDVVATLKKAKTRFHLSNFVKVKSKMKKIMSSFVVNLWFASSHPSEIFFKYEYDEEFWSAEFCSPSDLFLDRDKRLSIVSEGNRYSEEKEARFNEIM